ncbi:MAG: hypothetical protein KC435_04570 [Thermomicrobiales bacterium]|nr:hypothetical protein [Thermomicrobiales bacterium]
MKALRVTLLLLLATVPGMAASQTPAATSTCPVTIAAEFGLPDGVEQESIWGIGLIRNDEVGVLLATNGAIVLGPEQEGEKISWWARDDKVHLTASARRTTTGEVIEDISLNAYASYVRPEQGVFYISGIDFPSDGCWELIARGNDSELIVTVLVIRMPGSIYSPN